MSDSIDAADTMAFLETLFQPDDVINIRVIDRHGNRPPENRWSSPGEFSQLLPILKGWNAQNREIYIGVNPRKGHNQNGDASVICARCLFVDFDNDVTVSQAIGAVAGLGLPMPSVTVESGHGVHLYWLLNEPLTDLAEFSRLQRMLIAALNTDKSIWNPERIMRLPGFWNTKFADVPKPCRLVERAPERLCDVSSMIEKMPDPQPSNDADNLLAQQAAELDRQHARKPKATNGTGSVIDTYNAAHSCYQLLLSAGYRANGKRGHLIRPGKEDAGTSVIADDQRSRHFSSNDPLNSGKFKGFDVHDAFDLFCHLHHRGDMKAAIKDAAQMLGMSATQNPASSEILQKTPEKGITQNSASNEATPEETPTPSFIPVESLLKNNPKLRRPIIHGLLRETETMNLIAPAKAGKSWLVNDLLLAVAAGRPWLGFDTVQGDVLLLDNELHPETIADRIPRVAEARGLYQSDFAGRLFIESMRGRLKDIFQLEPYFGAIQPRRFRVIVLDAFYRFLPAQSDENSNGDMKDVYNALDRYAERLQCAFVLIHHTSKGVQGGKNVVDVGAGGSAQARATDAHGVLRHHEEDGVVVFEAANRSWPPLPPVCLRWNFPIWERDDSLDPTLLRVENRRRKIKDPVGDHQPAEEKSQPFIWTQKEFAAAFVTSDPRTIDEILIAAQLEKVGNTRARGLLKVAIKQGLVYEWPNPSDGRSKLYANRAQLIAETVPTGTPSEVSNG